MRNLKFLKQYYKGYLIAHLNKNISSDKKQFKDIGILYPGIATSNLGDLIIYDSVYSELRKIYPFDLFTNYPTQIYTNYDTMALMSQKDLIFISGTNLLTSDLDSNHQWKIHSGHKPFLQNKIVLFGCGWWQYQGSINSYSADIYKTILNKEVIHSVRDQYTVDKLKNIGIDNVVNTTCPTLWNLTPEICKLVPKSKGKNVVTTLTCYHKNVSLDNKMLEFLSKNYETVYLWIQGIADLAYYDEIKSNIKNIELIAPTIEAFDKILEEEDLDYVGTRLHAGVRALQNKRRTQIIAVDNRAVEIGKDVNLNVIKRENIENLEKFFKSDYTTDIHLPIENINLWQKSLENIKL